MILKRGIRLLIDNMTNVKKARSKDDSHSSEQGRKAITLTPLSFYEALRGLLETPPVKDEALAERSRVKTAGKKKRAPKTVLE